MSKFKFLLLFVVNTVIITSIYYFVANELRFPYIAIIYMVAAVVAICGYALLCMHHNNEFAKAKLEGKELDEELISYRKRRLKLYIVFFFPFVITFLIDCTYMFLLADNPLVQSIINFLK